MDVQLQLISLIVDYGGRDYLVKNLTESLNVSPDYAKPYLRAVIIFYDSLFSTQIDILATRDANEEIIFDYINVLDELSAEIDIKGSVSCVVGLLKHVYYYRNTLTLVS